MKNVSNTPEQARQSSIAELDLELLTAVSGGGFIEQENGPDFTGQTLDFDSASQNPTFG